MVAKQSLMERLTNRFNSGKARNVANPLHDIIEDQRRNNIDTSDTNPFKEPKWDFELLEKWGVYSPALRTTHESIITEATRNGGGVKPRWMSKCPSCGSKFQTEKETCPECEVTTIKPDINQKSLLEAFVDDPNSDNELIDLQKSSMRAMLRLSNAYISVQKADISKLQPVTIYVENAVKMRVANKNRPEYFCPQCTAKHPEETIPRGQPCRRCGNRETKLTAFYYFDGKVTARWAKDEMVHFNLDPNLPDEYGLSREISVLNTLSTLDAMDNLNMENYTEGKVANILVMEGLNQTEANKLAQDSKSQQDKPQLNLSTGRWFVKKLKTLILGTGGKGAVTNVPSMPDYEKMQSLEWYKKYESRINAIYGVQDIYTGQVQEGSTGQNPRSKNDINNNNTEFYQHSWTDPFNNVVVLQALGVTDWVWEFDPVEEKDEAQDMAILQAKLLAIQTAVNLGMDAELTDEQEVKISGKPETLEEKQQRSLDIMQKQAALAPNDATPGASPFSGGKPFKKEAVFANEKARESWIVTKVSKEEKQN